MSEQWTYTEVAQHIGVTVSTARRMRGKGSIPDPDGRLGGDPVVVTRHDPSVGSGTPRAWCRWRQAAQAS